MTLEDLMEKISRDDLSDSERQRLRAEIELRADYQEQVKLFKTVERVLRSPQSPPSGWETLATKFKQKAAQKKRVELYYGIGAVGQFIAGLSILIFSNDGSQWAPILGGVLLGGAGLFVVLLLVGATKKRTRRKRQSKLECYATRMEAVFNSHRTGCDMELVGECSNVSERHVSIGHRLAGG